MIDPLGRVDAHLALGQVGFLDADLPRALPRTAYARLGDAGFLLLLAFCFLCSSAIGQARKENPPEALS